MWTLVASFFGKIFSALIGRWLVRREAKKEIVAEIKQEDRKKANEIRDRVDNAKSTGGVRPKSDDSRGYRD
jgi:hypothetical protein